MTGNSTAQALELPFLHDAKKLWLQLHGRSPISSKNRGASVSALKPSDTARHRAGVGAALVAEQLAFQQAGRDCGAIHFHERPIRSVDCGCE